MFDPADPDGFLYLTDSGPMLYDGPPFIAGPWAWRNSQKKQGPIFFHMEACFMEQREVGGVHYITGHWPLDSKKATLIFIHGAASAQSFWEGQIDALGDMANVVAFDLPGHGKDQRPGKESISDYADAAAAFVDALRPPAPTLCGLSMGGAIVMELMINDRRGLFSSGILINTGARLKTDPIIIETIEKNYDGFVKLLSAFAISKNIDPKTIASHIQAMSECSSAVAAGDFRACNDFDVRKRLGEIDAPMLILTARDDLLTPPAYGEFLAENIPGARLRQIEGAGHLSPIEKPETVNEHIRDFFRDVGLGGL